MKQPIFTRNLNSYDMFWPDEKININVTRLSEHSDGLKGEILITTTDKKSEAHLHGAQFNFSSSVTRGRLATELQKRADIKWDDILEQLCAYITKAFRRGEPIQTICSEDESSPPEYLINPLILKNEVNMIYGEGGAGKSYLSLLIAAIVSIPLTKNNLQLAPNNSDGVNVLILDWETHKDIMAFRWKMVINGLTDRSKNYALQYRECALPLADDLEQIQRAIQDCGAEFVIVDSVGMAAGGDINQQAIALNFMNAVRRLKTTVLLVHHTAKNQIGKTTPFGSVYFTNASRNIFEIKKTQEDNQNNITVCLVHTKFNYSNKLSPRAIKIIFDEKTATRFEPVDASKIPDFKESFPIYQRIAQELDGHKPMTISEINKASGLPVKTIETMFRNYPGKFVELEVNSVSHWALAAEGY
jgi:hypothetical protein